MKRFIIPILIMFPLTVFAQNSITDDIIIENYQKDVTEAAEKVGLRVKEVTRIKDWVGLLMEKAE